MRTRRRTNGLTVLNVTFFVASFVAAFLFIYIASRLVSLVEAQLIIQPLVGA